MAPSFASLESFYWVAHLQSFSGAANLLNISQPTVSYRIRELESQLGVQLFVRKGRTFSITSDGAALRGYAEQMISVARNIESNIQVRGSGPRRLRIGVIDSFAAICLPFLLNQLEARFPNMRVATTIDNSYLLAARLADGELDVALLSTPPAYANIDLQLLGQQKVEWIANPDLGLSSGPISISDLMKQRIFCTPAPSNLHSLTMAIFSGVHEAGLGLNDCNSLAAILDLVRAKVGICLVPTRLAQVDLAQGRLSIIDTGTLLPLQDVFIGTNKGVVNRSLPQVLRFIKKVSKDLEYCTVAGADGVPPVHPEPKIRSGSE